MSSKYEFIDGEKGNYPVYKMVQWLGVSSSGYYEWRSRPTSATARRREDLKAVIQTVFDDSDGTYGYRRIHAALKVERVNRTQYPTREHARTDVTRYIEFRYNRKRIHSGLGYRTPEEAYNDFYNLAIAA